MRRAIACLLPLLLATTDKFTFLHASAPGATETGTSAVSIAAATAKDNANPTNAQPARPSTQPAKSDLPANLSEKNEAADDKPPPPIETTTPIRTNANVSLPQDI